MRTTAFGGGGGAIGTGPSVTSVMADDVLVSTGIWMFTSGGGTSTGGRSISGGGGGGGGSSSAISSMMSVWIGGASTSTTLRASPFASAQTSSA